MTIRIEFGEKTVRVAVELNGAIESAMTYLPERKWVGLEPSDWPLPQYEYSPEFQVGAQWAADILKEKNT